MQLTTSVRPGVKVPRGTLQRVARYDVISVETYEQLGSSHGLEARLRRVRDFAVQGR